MLTGGNSNIPGFRQRVESELERLKPVNNQIKIAQVDEPHLAVCSGLKNLSCSESFIEHSVSKREWEEQGVRAFLKCVL